MPSIMDRKKLMALGIAGFILSQPDLACGLDPAQLSFDPSAMHNVSSVSLQSPAAESNSFSGDLAAVIKLREQFLPIKKSAEKIFSHAHEVRKACVERSRAITQVLSSPDLGYDSHIDIEEISQARDKILNSIKEIEENREETRASFAFLTTVGAYGEMFTSLSKLVPNGGDPLQDEYKKILAAAGTCVCAADSEMHAAYRAQFDLLLTLKSALALLNVEEHPKTISSADEMDAFLADIWG